jgi:predicted nuclease with RNAse H fold
MKWVGVDYGSKIAGTTAIYFLDKNTLTCLQSQKKSDADMMIYKFIKEHKVENVFLDAPLSLPGAFTNKNQEYFYRQCDKLTKAMSPMFLGGLTARAIKLKDSLPKVTFFETYPAYLIKQILEWQDDYRKKEKINSGIINRFTKVLPNKLKQSPDNWHQLDALACWYSGWRYFEGISIEIGDEKEGVITV